MTTYTHAAADVVFCFDAETGKTLWQARLDGPATESGSSTPCISAGHLYVAGSAGEVHCLDAKTGNRIWRQSLGRSSSESVASSPAVAGDVVVVLADELTGLKAGTGEVLWTQPKITGRESSPACWESKGKTWVICNSGRETHCVDPADGKIVWSVPGGGKSTPVVAQEYGGDFLVNMASGGRGGLSAYRLAPDGPKELWTKPFSDRASSPVVFDGHVYAIAGGSNGHGAHIVCVYLDTGKVAWDEAIDFAEVSSPVVADGKFFAVCGTFLWVLQASPERYTVLNQADCRITLCTSPAIAGGRLFLRQNNAIACYDLRAR
jgi:outer membrane protein assembly factor BamB